MLGHAGNMPGYFSSLTLIPEKNVGIFTAFNCCNPGLPGTILPRFFDRYYPASKPAVPDAANNVNLQTFTGTYPIWNTPMLR
ncbi:MAG TPA: hypothetical protein V6C91_06500 [Coleofasciculaceae cyanobacterium]